MSKEQSISITHPKKIYQKKKGIEKRKEKQRAQPERNLDWS